MDEELIEEILNNGFDVYEALEKYNLEIMDDEITGNEEEIEMFLKEMISEVGLILTRELISGQEETEEILEDLLRAGEENFKHAQTLRELLESYDEADQVNEEELASIEKEQNKKIQEEEKQKNEKIKAEIIEQIKNKSRNDIDDILIKYDLRIIDDEIVSYDDSFVLLDKKEVREILKESKFEIFKRETDYSSHDFMVFYLENYFLLNMKLSDEQRANIFKNIDKNEFVNKFYNNYYEDFNNYFLKMDSLEEQEKLNFIKGAIYLIYYVLNAVSYTTQNSQNSQNYNYDILKNDCLETIKDFNYIILTSKNFVQKKNR